MKEPDRWTIGAVRRAIVRASLGTPTAQARAALEAAAPWFEERQAEAVQAERLSILGGSETTEAQADRVSVNILIAAQERSARHEVRQQAVAVCIKIARRHRRAGRVAASYAALECVEAVRALLPEVED